MKARFLGLAAAAIGCFAVLPVYAGTCVDGMDPLTCDGVTYSLTQATTANPNVDNYTLTITGINGASDTEGGRYGVLALAFNQPSGFVSATAPSGFNYEGGGLDSSGCDGSGNFFCFMNSGSITQSPLAADSTLSFNFSVDATGLATWGSDGNESAFKVTWDGSNSKWNKDGKFTSGYDLVSKNLPPMAAPEIDPASATAAFTFLLGGLAVMRGRRRQVA